MDEQKIMIDNVDISECEFYIDSKNLEYNCKQTPQSYFCKNNPNCYYKQLKAKEQECEELKKQVCGLRPELKFIIDKICCKYNIEAKNYHEKIVEIINKLDKYKQTLAEIKRIATKAKKDICNNCAWRNTDSCDPEYYTCGELIKILQKINEVLNGTNP